MHMFSVSLKKIETISFLLLFTIEKAGIDLISSQESNSIVIPVLYSKRYLSELGAVLNRYLPKMATVQISGQPHIPREAV